MKSGIRLRVVTGLVAWAPYTSAGSCTAWDADHPPKLSTTHVFRSGSPAITRLADAPADEGLMLREIWLLRLRALLARAHGDDTAYRDYRDRYREMATTLGFEGHIAWAEAMA